MGGLLIILNFIKILTFILHKCHLNGSSEC